VFLKKSVIATFVAVLFLSLPSLAQTSLGTITGVVTDPKGAVVIKATVTATNNANGEKHTTTNNELGAYRIDLVSPGTYTITVKAPGFAELKLTSVVVTASVSTTANAALAIGQAETVIEVNAIGAEIHTEDGALSHDISNLEVTQIPLASGNPIELTLTEPGITRPTQGGFSNGFNISVNGTRSRSNNFLIEGQDNNDTAIQGQALQVINVEAVNELNIQTNSYPAEFGHGGGSVTNLIYKSGTNTWHGSLFNTLQNSSLNSADAADKLAGSPKALSRENTFGFTIGGALVKNKLFIFGSSQWDKTRQTANGGTITIPTANGVATLESLPANPRINNYLAAIGNLRGLTKVSTIALTSGLLEVGQVQRQVGEPANDTQYIIKSDWTPSQRDTFTVRYVHDSNNITPDFFNLPNQLPGFDTQQGGTVHNAGFSYARSFTPTLVNELRASFGRIEFSFTPTAQTLANPLANGPTITISGVRGFGAPGGIPQARTHDTYQYQDTVSWSKGRHSFKFGVDLAQVKVVDEIPFNGLGSISYTNGGGATGFQNFIDDFTGVTGSVSRNFGSPFTRPHYFYQNYFAQDAWKIRSNLTVNYGVRYENGGTPENNLPFPAIVPVFGLGGVTNLNFVKQEAANNDWAPRLGMAYTPRFWKSIFGNDQTVFRAGFGVYFDSFFSNIIDNSASSSPNVVAPQLIVNTGRGVQNASSAFGKLNPVASPNDVVQTIVNDLKTPTTYQWNFDIERELPWKFALTTSYVGTRGLRLYGNDDLNPFDVFGANPNVRLDPNRNDVTVRDNSADSIYHALDLKLDRRFYKGLLIRTSYTFSKLIDDASEVFITTGTSSFPADLTPGHRVVDRGLSAYNHAQAFGLTYIYDLPQFTSTGNFAAKTFGQIVNGWQIAGVTTYQTGAPQTVTDGFDAAGFGRSIERPNLLNAGAPLLNVALDSSQLGLAPGTFCEISAAFATGLCDPFVNGTATIVRSATTHRIIGFTGGTALDASNVHFFIPGSGIGTLGRNTIIAPGRQDWTFGVQRTFKIGERQQLVFRSEMINPLNHPNTGNAGFALANISFIDIASIDPTSLRPLSNTPPTQLVGNYGQTIIGQRQIHFKLKWQF
jgi:hypothetical protein